MANILYISYDGLGEPLGQSQILEYLLLLSASHSITLLTFEKPGLDPELRQALDIATRRAGIHWVSLRYHKRLKLLAALYDTLAAFIVGTWLSYTRHIQIIHARSYLPGAMGSAIRAVAGGRLLFDIRGFWADQRADCGAWRRTQLSYQLAKRVERMLFLNCDGIVSLTRAALLEIAALPYMGGKMPPNEVIPTCVNLEAFSFEANAPSPEEDGPVIGFMGNATLWYRLEEMAEAFAAIRSVERRARLLVVNRGDHDIIRRALQKCLPDLSCVEFVAVDYHEVPAQIRRMDGAVFFLKEFPSMSAVCPTRLAEFLACGVPVMTNGGHGDARSLLTESKTGVIFDGTGPVRPAAQEFIRLMSDPGVRLRCRELAQRHFSLHAGVAGYERLYRALSS